MAHNKDLFLNEYAYNQNKNTYNQNTKTMLDNIQSYVNRAIEESATSPSFQSAIGRKALKRARGIAGNEDRIRSIVAMMNANGVNNTILASNESKILSSYNHVNLPSQYTEPSELKSTYASMKGGFFGYLTDLETTVVEGTKKRHTSSEFISHVQDVNDILTTYTRAKAATSYATAMQGFNNFQNAEQFMSFDLETLGGRNASGYRTLDNITEYSFDLYNKSDLESPIERMTSFIGINKTEGLQYLKEIQDMRITGVNQDRLNVIAGRFGKYGLAGTSIESILDDNGKETGRYVAKISTNEEGIGDLETIERGIRRSYETREKINAFTKASGKSLAPWEEDMVKALTIINEGKTFVVGQNDINADLPWLNEFIAGSKTSKEFKQALRGALGQNGVPYIKNNPYMHSDMLTLLNFFSEVGNKNDIYNGHLDLLSGNSQFQLESLVSRFFPQLHNTSASHSADFDTNAVARLYGQGLDEFEGKSFVQHLVDNIHQGVINSGGPNKAKAFSVNHTLRGGNQVLYMADAGSKFNNFSRSGSLTFMYDKIGDSFRTANGFNVKNWLESTNPLDLVKNDMSLSDLSKNGTYTIGWMKQLDMSQEWVDRMAKVHPEYSVGRLYAALINPVYDPAVGHEAQYRLKSPIVKIFTQEEAMRAWGSSLIPIAQRKQGFDAVNALNNPNAWESILFNGNGVIDDEGVRTVKELLSLNGTEIDPATGKTRRVPLVTGAGTPGPYDPKRIIRHSTWQQTNDPAARMIRDEKWGHTYKFNKLYDRMLTDLGKKDATIMPSEVTQYISKLIASGNPLTLELQNELQHTFNGEKNLYSNTVSNIISAFPYMQSQKPVSDKIISAIDEYAAQTGKELTSAEKDFMFMNALEDAKAYMAGAENLTPEQTRRLAMNYKDQAFAYGKDLNTFTFQLNDFIPESRTSVINDGMFGATTRDAIGVNLDPNKEYSLVSQLFNMRYGPKTLADKEGAQGRAELARFIEAVKHDPERRYRGLFDHFDYDPYLKEGVKASVFGQEVMNRIRNYAGTHDGYVSQLDISDVMKESALFSVYDEAKHGAGITQAIKGSFAKHPSLVMLNSDSEIGAHVDSILNNIVMPFSESDVLSAAKRNGMTDTEMRVQKEVYGMAREDMKSYLGSFIRGAKATQTQFMYDTKNKSVFLMKGGRSVNIDLPTVNFDGYRMYTEIGLNRVALSPKLDLSGVIKTGNFNRNNVRVRSNIFGATEESLTPETAFISAYRRGKDTLTYGASIIQSLKGNLRELPDASVGHLSDIHRVYEMDVNDIFKALPQIEESGILNTYANRTPALRELITQANKRKRPIESMAGAGSALRESAAREMVWLLRKISEGTTLPGEQQNVFEFFASNLSGMTNETKLSEGTFAVGSHTMGAGQQFNNLQRPPVTQGGREIVYEKDLLRRGIGSISNSKLRNALRIGTIVDSPKSELLNRTINGIETSSTASMKSLSISESNFKNRIVEEYQKSLRGESSAFDGLSESEREVVYDKLKELNLYEQESVVNSRTWNAVFTKQNLQRINARKMVEIQHDNNLTTISNIKNFDKLLPVVNLDGKITFTYGSGRTVRKEDVLLKTISNFGGSVAKSAKYNGQFKFGFMTHNSQLLVSQETIEQMLNKEAATNPGAFKTAGDVFSFLEKTYDPFFYLDHANTSTYQKGIIGMAEKTMMHSATLQVGQTDVVRSMLRGTKFEGLIGQVIKPGEISGLGGKVMAAINRERHLASDVLGNIFGQDVSIFMDLATTKHQNTQVAMESLLGLIAERKDAAWIQENLIPALNKNGEGIKGISFDPKTKHVVFPEELRGAEDFYSEVDIFKVAKAAGFTFEHKNKDGKTEEYIGEAVYGSDGKTVIGSKGWANVRHMIDEPGGTYSRPIDEKYKAEINKLDDALKDTTLGRAEREALISQKGMLTDKYQGIKSMFRGVKMTDRGLQILEAKRIDDNLVKSLRNNLSEDEFFKTIGYALERDADGKYKVAKEYMNQPLVGAYADILRENLLTGKDGEETFKAYVNRINPEEGSDLYKFNKALENAPLYDKIGYSKALELESFIHGSRAISWNSSDNPYETIDQLKNSGFKIKGVGDIDLPFSGDAKTVTAGPQNVITENTLIDLGDGIADSRKRYLAVPKTPLRITGDDQYIPYKFQTALKTLKTRYEDLTNSDLNYTPEQRQARYEEAAEKVRESLVSDFTGKDSIGANLSTYRASTSHMGKASSIVWNLPEGYDSLSTKKRVEQLALRNYASLNKAKFMGKTLVQHYAEGKIIDAQFKSTQAFRDMGFFDPTRMKEILGDNASEEGMMRYLEENGTMAVKTRYPQIQEGSDTMSMVYLDRGLDGARTKYIGAAQKAAGGDNDGDLIQALIAKDRNGRDYAHYQTLKDSEKAGSMFRSLETHIMSRAVTSNAVFENALRVDLGKAGDKAIGSMDFRKVGAERSINGRIYAEIGVPTSAEEIQSAINKSEAIKSALDATGAVYKSKQDYFNQAMTYVSNLAVSEAEKTSAKKAIVTTEMFDIMERGIVAKSKKLTIGEINLPLHTVRKMGELAGSKSMPVIQMMANIAEQEVISSKKDVAISDPLKTTQLRDAIYGVVFGDRRDINKHSTNLKNWLTQYTSGDMEGDLSEILKLSEPDRATLGTLQKGGPLAENLINEAVATLQGFNTPQLRGQRNYLTLFQGRAGNRNVVDALSNVPENDRTLMGTMLKQIQATGMLPMRMVSGDAFREARTNQFLGDMNIVDGREWIDAGNNARSGAEQILRSAESTISSIVRTVGGKNLAFGALGLAGAFMVAGYAGGNPSKPAETQADEVANDDSQFYTAPSLQDPDLAQASAQTGYVININAKSGNSRQQVTEAVSRAISSGMRTDVNIAMNIKEDPGNISDRSIQQLLTGAFQ